MPPTVASSACQFHLECTVSLRTFSCQNIILLSSHSLRQKLLYCMLNSTNTTQRNAPYFDRSFARADQKSNNFWQIRPKSTVMDFWEDLWTLAPLHVHYSHYSDKKCSTAWLPLLLLLMAFGLSLH